MKKSVQQGVRHESSNPIAPMIALDATLFVVWIASGNLAHFKRQVKLNTWSVLMKDLRDGRSSAPVHGVSRRGRVPVDRSDGDIPSVQDRV